MGKGVSRPTGGTGPRRGLGPVAGLGMGLAAGLLALLLYFGGWLAPWERVTWDWRCRLLARPAATTARVKLVVLDQASLDWAAQHSGLGWPWPRQAYVPIIRFLQRAGAKAIAFDVLFTEPSTYGPEDDQALSKAITASGNFVAAIFLGHTTGSATGWPAGLAARLAPIAGGRRWVAADPARRLPRALLPIPEVAGAAAGLGNVKEDPDPDQVIRRITLLRGFGGQAVPALPLAALLAGGGVPAAVRGGVLRVGETEVRLDQRGAAILRYRGGPGTHQAFSAAAVIQSELVLAGGGDHPPVDPAVFKNAYVLFGFTAPGLHDLRAAPVSPLYPGVEMHATALDNLLAGDFIAAAPAWAVAAGVLGLTLLCGLVGVRLTKPWQSAVGLAVLVPLPAGLGVAAYLAGWWWPVTAGTVGVVLTLLAALVLNYAFVGRHARFIGKAFKHYLSPAVIDQLLADPSALRLGGERRELSIFFSDLAGFTSISEGLDPEQLTALLNDYLTDMSDIIMELGGTVDKYEGDAIIAFWNAPLPVKDHALMACRAALACQERLAQREEDFRRVAGRPLSARIGINTGVVVVGNLGSTRRFDYTVLGDAANLASRLEGANKVFGTPIMVSAATWRQTGGALVGRRLGRVRVVGRSEAVEVYQPLGDPGRVDLRVKELFEEGLALVEAGQFGEAIMRFMALGDDPPAAAYVARLRRVIQGDEPAFDGVWNLTTK